MAGPNKTVLTSLLVLGQLAPLRVVPCLACELRYQDPVGPRALTDHVFYYRGRSPGLATRASAVALVMSHPEGSSLAAFRKAHHPGAGAWARSRTMTLMAVVTPNRDLGRLGRGDAQSENLTASYADGVLHVTIPSRPRSRPAGSRSPMRPAAAAPSPGAQLSRVGRPPAALAEHPPDLVGARRHGIRAGQGRVGRERRAGNPVAVAGRPCHV